MAKLRPAICVLQPWVMSLPMMQQSVLLTAIRGPDGIPKYGPVKLLLRWYRRCVLYTAMDRVILTDPLDLRGGSFTGPSHKLPKGISDEAAKLALASWEVFMDDLVGEYLQASDALPHHFQMHFMHAVEIAGYKHSDDRIRAWWHTVYLRLVHDLHLVCESEKTMDFRLGDNEANWRSTSDKATSE